MELPTFNNFQNQIYYVYYKGEGHLLANCKNVKQVMCHICQRSNHSMETCPYNPRSSQFEETPFPRTNQVQPQVVYHFSSPTISMYPSSQTIVPFLAIYAQQSFFNNPTFYTISTSSYPIQPTINALPPTTYPTPQVNYPSHLPPYPPPTFGRQI